MVERICIKSIDKAFQNWDNNPKDAVIANSNIGTALVVFGLCFTFVPLFFMLLFLSIFSKSLGKILDKFNILPILIGISFITIGSAPIILYENNLLGYIILAPFIIFGIYMVIKNIFFYKK